ncbi:MAG: glycosyltransferase [Candidatus Magasanikbacteria bacterium]|nr:glycosyltransferase [Candidatus Magasanikbacteria bacterium]
MKPTVSVIIPVYNHAHTLDDCLGTIVWGAYSCEMEIIIVNDGSTDNFHEELDKILNNFPDVKKLVKKVIDQPNLGATEFSRCKKIS